MGVGRMSSSESTVEQVLTYLIPASEFISNRNSMLIDCFTPCLSSRVTVPLKGVFEEMMDESDVSLVSSDEPCELVPTKLEDV